MSIGNKNEGKEKTMMVKLLFRVLFLKKEEMEEEDEEKEEEEERKEENERIFTIIRTLYSYYYVESYTCRCNYYSTTILCSYNIIYDSSINK